MNATLKVRLVGLLMIGALVGLFALAAAFYAQVFVPRVPVTLIADRSGLVMDPGNAVTLRGVEVGRVTEVVERDGRAVLTLGIDPGQLERIPADVLAEITPTTVFGAKLVTLSLPERPSPVPLARDAVLDGDGVTVEVNSVFDNLSALLRTVDPAKINATLGELARALDGRGDDVARLAAATDDYLGRFNEQLPVLERDLVELGGVTQVYADIAPDLLDVLDNATVTGATVVQEADQLDGFLLDVTGLAVTGQEVLAENRDDLVTALDLLRPTTELLRRYDPGLTCFIQGLDEARRALEPVIGGASPEVRLDSTLTIGQAPYENPDDLPEFESDRGPDCHGLPVLDGDELPAPAIDSGTNEPADSGTNAPELGRPPFAPLLTAPSAGEGDR